MAVNIPVNPDHSWGRSQKAWEVGFLHTYPITMFLGVLVSFLTIAYFWKKQKYSWEILQVLVILIVPGSIIGARLWYLISEGGWEQWYFLSGLSIQGGVMGALIAGSPFLYFRRHAVDMRTVYGIIIPNVIIGQAIGRWGNFANHEVYGQIVSGDSLNWMGSMKAHMFIGNVKDMTVNGVFEHAGTGHYRAPLFFYEFISSLIGWFIMTWILLRKNYVKPAGTGAIYLVWYGVVRISMEPLRVEVDIMKWGMLPISTFLSGVMIVVGFFLFVWLQFTNEISTALLKISSNKNTWWNRTLTKASKPKYQMIKPIKNRRLFWVGNKTDKKYQVSFSKDKKYRIYLKEVDNRINILLPIKDDEKWSKRELNRGKKNKVKK